MVLCASKCPYMAACGLGVVRVGESDMGLCASMCRYMAACRSACLCTLSFAESTYKPKSAGCFKFTRGC